MKPRHMFYMLDDEHRPIPTDDVCVWGAWYEDNNNRRVAEDFVDDIRISTVCLGVDHQYGNGPPLIFETMIFGGELDEHMWRYSTWDDAEVGHKMAVKKARDNADSR